MEVDHHDNQAQHELDTTQADQSLDMPAAPIPPASALDFSLSTGVVVLLKRTGLLSSAPTSTASASTSTSTSTSVLSHANSQTGWLPLLPLADAHLLLSCVPSSLLTANLPITSIAPAPATSATRVRLLDTLARLALEPSLTMEVMFAFRAVASVLWGRWLEMLGFDAGEGAWREGGEREGERGAVEKVLAAFVRLLPVFENAFP